MIYIKLDENNYVQYTNYMPFDDKYGEGKSREELLEKGYLIENIPEAPTMEGKYVKTKYIDGEFVFEYEDIPVQPPSEIEQLRAENLELKLALAEMAEVQEQHKLETQLALAELAEAMAGGVYNG